MQIYPEKYDQLDQSSEEKSFMRTLERSLIDTDFAYYILHINPRRKDIGDGKPELFNLLIIDKGILLFKFINEDVISNALVQINVLSRAAIFEHLMNEILARLQISRYLTDESGKLLHSLNICFVFPKIRFLEIERLLDPSIALFCRNHILFLDTILSLRTSGKEVITGLLNTSMDISEDSVNHILLRLCPEITIPRKYLISEHDKVDGLDGGLNDADRSVQSFRLDNKQIDFVNRISKGNQLILACAGSGKSVLLIAKCFKLASLNPAKQFLITCYNRNLYYYYQWVIAQAGFTNRNVSCVTFFGLCKMLLERNKIPVPQFMGDNYDRLFDSANFALQDKRIKDRYYGVFIDEVQIFRPEWYRFCYNLLQSKDSNEHVFVIAGDKSQDIKRNIRQGNAPWQGGGTMFPDYRGKTLTIEINYRNSKPINDFIDKFVNRAKKKANSLEIDLESDHELFLRGTANRAGNPPQLIELRNYSNQGEADAIGRSVQGFLDRGLTEVDIAVIFYNENFQSGFTGWKTQHYKLLPYLRQYFTVHKWEEPTIIMQGQNDGASYGSRRGVTFASIEGSLGLDFKAVVLAGLRPMGAHELVRTTKAITEASPELKDDRKEGFVKNVNFLYTGMTRARDELNIIISAKREESIYLDLLRDAMEDFKNEHV